MDENQNDDPAATAVEFRTIEVVPWIFFFVGIGCFLEEEALVFFWGKRRVGVRMKETIKGYCWAC